MNHQIGIRYMVATMAAALSWSPSVLAQTLWTITPVAPRTWEDAEIARLEIPLANAMGSPKHVSADYYYKIPVRPIYKQYPVYAPDREPAGYLLWLKEQQPQILWTGDSIAPKLVSESDWSKAGQIVFDAPIVYSTENRGGFLLEDVRNSDWFKTGKTPLTPDGILPYVHYVVREKGKVELGSFSCGMCHTRIMPGGKVLKGAQGDFPFGQALAQSASIPWPALQKLFAMPWMHPDPLDRLRSFSDRQIRSLLASIPPGVLPRHRASLLEPVQIPSLIGVKDRHYLDRTGLQQQRSIADLMRYAAMNQGADFLASFAGFVPADIPNFRMPPKPSDPTGVGGRYSDIQLYALARYVYSLTAPPNPNPFNESAARGRTIFVREGCAGCHKPPLYTNNKLTPANGFLIPPDHSSRYDILRTSVGTDPDLTLKTRRGTGYYKVPALTGVWYRGMFGHSGWCATLQDWFDPKRITDRYVPTGFRPYGFETYSVKGHNYGLDLSGPEKQDLIAFLKTL